MSIIESDDYRKTRELLKKDPIIIDMVKELFVFEGSKERAIAVVTNGHIDRLPSWDFMQVAIDTYNKRGGKIDTHIGGPIEAIIELLNEKVD